MAIRKRGKIWFVYFRNSAGRIIERSLETKDRDDAEKRAAVVLKQIDTAKAEYRMKELMAHAKELAVPQVQPTALPLPYPQSASEQAATVEGAQDGALSMRDAFECASRRNERIGKKHMLEWQRFIGQCPVAFANQVTPKIVLNYLEANYAGASPKTYNNARSLLNVIFKTVLIDANMQVSPVAAVLPRKVQGNETHFRDFTPDECRRILEAVEDCPYWKCLCMIGMYTGLRLETCRRLAPWHIKDKAITIMPGKTARYGRAVWIPILPPLWEYLSGIPSEPGSHAPFCESFTRVWKWPGSKDGNNQLPYFTGLLESLRITPLNGEDVGFPSFRCAYATRLSEHGVSDRVMRGILGHTKQKQTDLYNHDTTSARKELEGLEF